MGLECKGNKWFKYKRKRPSFLNLENEEHCVDSKRKIPEEPLMKEGLFCWFMKAIYIYVKQSFKY